MKNLLFAFAAAIMMSACGDKEQPASPESQVPAAAQQAQPAKTEKAKAPEKLTAAAEYVKKDTYFKLPGAAGGEIDLAAYSGKPVMVMFFTETCPYCRKAAPFIQKTHASYGPKGLQVLGICVQSSAQAALNFAEDLGVTFPLAYNGKDISRNYRTQGVPYIYLLDQSHEIYDVWEGYDPQYDQSIIKAVETVLAKK